MVRAKLKAVRVRRGQGHAPSAWLAAIIALLGVSGCATFRSYNEELDRTLTMAASGNLDTAVKTLERLHDGEDKDLLYYLEMGELERLRGGVAASQSAWLDADTRVRAWEEAARADPARVSRTALSYILNDKVRPYEGHDYEKVMLTTRIAMNHLAQGEWDNARVAIKRTHEREAVIAQVRTRELQGIEAEARKRGVQATFKDLGGYPVQTVDSPEVNALRNSYQSGFSHYLAGFVYEALGEPSLAAAGYRQAIELRPGLPLLEDGLAGLDQRMTAADDGRSDVLLVVETGFAPARVSRHFNLPIPINGRWVLVPVSFPVMQSGGADFAPAAIHLDDTETLTPTAVTSIDAMARRALADEMPGITLRAAVRATAKATAQYQAQRAAEKRRRKGDANAAKALDGAAIALAIGAAATESADERAWRSLPGRIHLARTRLSRGRHTLEIDTPDGTQRIEAEIDGRHALIALRLIRGKLFALLPQAPRAAAASARPSPARTVSEKAPTSDAPDLLPTGREAVVEPQSHAKEYVQ